MQYITNEASLKLPSEAIKDTTVNVIRFPDLETTLVFSRSELAEHETLESSLEEQLKRMGKAVSSLRFSQRKAIKFGKNQDIDAIELSNQFIKGKDSVYQYQLACIIPGTRTLFAISYAKGSALGEAEATQWQYIKNNFEFTNTN